MSVSMKNFYAQSVGRRDAAVGDSNRNPYRVGSPDWYSYERGYSEAAEVYNALDLSKEVCVAGHP